MLETIFVVTFAFAFVALNRLLRRKPNPKPETVKDLLAWKQNVTTDWQG